MDFTGECYEEYTQAVMILGVSSTEPVVPGHRQPGTQFNMIRWIPDIWLRQIPGRRCQNNA